MATASASAAQLRYLVETVEGTTPAGDPKRYRVTKESLNQSIEAQSSQELRADRQVSDVSLVSGSVGGSLDWELSFKTHDDFIEALLASTWVVGGTDGVKSCTAVTYTHATKIFASTTQFPAMERGQWFRISGHPTAAINGVYRCSTTVAPTTSSITIDTAAGEPGVDGASQTVSLSTSRIKNGLADLKTFSIEKCFSDVDQYFMATGMAVQSMNLNFNTGETIKGSFAFLGRTMTRDTATMFPDGIGSEVAATTTPLVNTVNNTVILLDGVSMGDSCAESFSLTVATGMKERRCLGSGIGLAGVSQGTFDINGSLNIYFGATTSASVYDKMIADQPISLSIYCEDANGDGYAFTIERAKISSSEVVAGGINTDVMMNLEVQATIGTVNGAMLIIDRLGSVA